MKVTYKKKSANFNQKLLCITHTDRSFHIERGNLNFLEKRYSDPNRLPPQEPFESLIPSIEHSPYLGSVTIWEFEENDIQKPNLLAHLQSNSYKPQHAIWFKERFWILGVELLEVYDSNFSLVAVIYDPWLAGGHTITPDGKGHLLVTCSASDSILLIDENTYGIISAYRMPESLYGFNYPLTREDSVVDHYIINDYQLTHVNCAWPWRNGFLVSSLIPGAIGLFNKKENIKNI